MFSVIPFALELEKINFAMYFALYFYFYSQDKKKVKLCYHPYLIYKFCHWCKRNNFTSNLNLLKAIVILLINTDTTFWLLWLVLPQNNTNSFIMMGPDVSDGYWWCCRQILTFLPILFLLPLIAIWQNGIWHEFTNETEVYHWIPPCRNKLDHFNI